MGGRTVTITPAQQAALERIRVADGKLETGRRTIEIEIRRQAEARLQGLVQERADAVRDAMDLGVSKRQIGLRGLTTKNPYAVDNALMAAGINPRTLDSSEPAQAIERAIVSSQVVSWITPDAAYARFPEFEREALVNVPEVLLVEYPDFPTSAQDAAGYPAVLTGLVIPTTKTRQTPAGYRVLFDPTDQATDAGVVPGWLRYEVETAPDTSENYLPRELDRFTGVAA